MDLSEKNACWLISFALLCSALLVYWPVRNFGYIGFDDQLYASHNPVVQAGLTWEGFRWAFTNTAAPYPHPLAWLSHMLDFELFGNNPGAQHLVNVGWHALNAVLLFYVLRKMTGALWRSALVALLFALHPLRVESVAWITERKDVLCAFFWILTMGTYARYAEKTNARNYALVSLSFALGLLAKPTLVTLPAVFLLLDFWPLQRFQAAGKSNAWKLLLEKIPWFALCGIWSWLTNRAAESAGVVVTLPLGSRAGNSLVAYVGYLEKTFWPADLSVLYPYWEASTSRIILAAGILSVVSMAILCSGCRRNYLLAGWLWFLGVLVPTIGFVQVGTQSMADRFSYIPHIGLFIGVIWLGHGLAEVLPKGRLVGGITVVLAIVFCGIASARRANDWKNTETLFQQALKVDPNNCIALAILGTERMQRGETDHAIAYFQNAIANCPDYADAHSHLGEVYLKQGKMDQAIAHYEKAVELKPGNPAAYRNLAYALAQSGRMPDALPHFQRAVQLSPGDAKAHRDLGNAYGALGNVAAAENEYAAALRADPKFADPHYNLGVLLEGQKRLDEAITHYREAIRLRPDFAGALNNLAWLLATSPDGRRRNGSEAVQLAENACRLTQGKEPLYLDTLAAAYAEAGRFTDAIALAQGVHASFVANGQTEMAKATEQRLSLYREGKPFRE